MQKQFPQGFVHTAQVQGEAMTLRLNSYSTVLSKSDFPEQCSPVSKYN